MNKIDTLWTRSIGSVCVSAFVCADESPDYSYLGEFSDFEASPLTICYDRETGNAWDGSRWRDERGRFAPEPEDIDGWRNEYRFITEAGCQCRTGENDWHRIAFANCQRLDQLDNDWQYVGVVVSVTVDGTRVGCASVWGIEHGWRDNNDYLLECAKELRGEALEEARRHCLAIGNAAKRSA